MIRSLAVAGVVLAATPARADDPYPTELVERAPVLPRDLTSILTTASLTDHGGTDSADGAIEARHSFGFVEPFVVVQVHPTSVDAWQRSPSALVIGARVPVTCRADVRADVWMIEPLAPAQQGDRADLAFEARQPIVGHRLAIAGTAGLTASSVPEPYPFPFGPPLFVQTTRERAFVGGELELQTAPEFALFGGAELDLERRNVAAAVQGISMTFDDGTRANAIYTLGFVSTKPRFDLGASMSHGEDGAHSVSVIAATFTARF